MERIVVGEPDVSSYPPGFDEVIAWAIKQEQDNEESRQSPCPDRRLCVEDIISAVSIYEIAATLSDPRARASIQTLAADVAARGVQAMKAGI